VLATSVDADTIYAVPTEIDNPVDAARKLCDALADCDGRDRAALAERLGQRKAFAYVRRQVAPDQARRVADLNLDGIGFTNIAMGVFGFAEIIRNLELPAESRDIVKAKISGLMPTRRRTGPCAISR